MIAKDWAMREMGAYQSRGTNLQIKDEYILEIKYTDNLYSVMIIINSVTYVSQFIFLPQFLSHCNKILK